MTTIFKLYKLIVLYMLDCINFPLTTSQISEFILEQGYTDYFKLQQAVGELAEDGLIRRDSTHNRTLYYLTDEGEKTILLFKNDISPDIRKDIQTFLKNKKYELKNEFSYMSNEEIKEKITKMQSDFLDIYNYKKDGDDVSGNNENMGN